VVDVAASDRSTKVFLEEFFLDSVILDLVIFHMGFFFSRIIYFLSSFHWHPLFFFWSTTSKSSKRGPNKFRAQQRLFVMNPNKIAACRHLINVHTGKYPRWQIETCFFLAIFSFFSWQPSFSCSSFGKLQWSFFSWQPLTTFDNLWFDLHTARNDKILVFSDDIFALRQYAVLLRVPMLYGDTPEKDRLSILTQFKTTPNVNVICISSVGDTSIDLPECTVIIQVASHFGARRQEAQRLGRVLRPKAGVRIHDGYVKCLMYWWWYSWCTLEYWSKYTKTGSDHLGCCIYDPRNFFSFFFFDRY
jgi:hypothetical protein